MLVQKHEDITSFSRLALPFLEREEAANNLMIGLALRYLEKNETPSNLMLLSVYDVDNLVLVAIQTSAEMPLLIYGEVDCLEDASLALCEYLEKLHFYPEKILGSKSYTEAFIKYWNAYFGLKTESVFDLRILQLDQLNKVNYSQGSFRQATNNDLNLLTKWVQAFDQETFSENITDEEAFKKTSEKMDNNDLFVWENEGEVVTMAATARPTRNGITINYVYTPPEHRRHGYATSCVARLSQLMLDQGYKFCSLFTDAANPTSNKIYENMGYYWVADFSNVKLVQSSKF